MEIKKLDIGTTLNNSFEIFKKTFLISGLAFLFITIALMAIITIGINYFIGLKNAAEQMKTFDPANLSTEGTFIYFGCILFISILLAPLTAGILKMMKDADTDQEVSFSTLFYYVNSPFYISIVATTFILTSFNFAITLGLQKFITDKMTESIITMLLSIFFSITLLLTIPNIIFKELKITEAITESFSFCLKNFFQILLLLLIAIAIGYAGIIGFCIGIFFTFPIYFTMQYSIYKNLN